jgi:DNA ligase-4
MKETVIGKYYVDILGIATTSEDAIRLIHWKKPTGGTTEKVAGDFGNAVFLSLKSRCVEKGDLSVAEINSVLDELILATERTEKIAVLKKLIRRATALEQKWIVRVILKDLKIGMSEKTILGYFHPDALSLYNISANLQQVCRDLKNPSVRITTAQSGVTIGQPIKPMLASRQPPETVVKVMDDNPFVIEKKYDGERVMIHKNGAEIKLFSRFRFFSYFLVKFIIFVFSTYRNCNNVTENYGDQLTPIIQQYVLVSRCIIDGELLVWDALTGQFEAFGKLKSLGNTSFSKKLVQMMFQS